MKRIFVTFLIVPILAFSQDKEVDELRNDLNIVKENLDLHHKQFISGAVISVIGGASTFAGSIIGAPVLIVGGGLASLIGGIIMFDSDKWFGKRYMDEETRERKKKVTVKGEDDVLLEYYLKYSKHENKHFNDINLRDIKTSVLRYDYICIITNEDTFFGVLSTHGKEQLELFYLTNNNYTYRLVKYNEIIKIKKLQLNAQVFYD